MLTEKRDSRAEGLAAKLMRVQSMFSMAACRERGSDQNQQVAREVVNAETYHLCPVLHRRVDSHL